MPRKRPSALRQGPAPSHLPPAARRDIPGLSPAAARAIAELESGRFRPGDISAAFRLWCDTATGPLREWESAVLAPDSDDFSDSLDCPCCYPPDRGRSTLEHAIALLRPRAARELRRQVRRLDWAIRSRARHAGASHLLEAWAAYWGFDWGTRRSRGR